MLKHRFFVGSKNRRAGGGFTLIELLIVIAIILILIAIALPNFLEAQNRARLTKAAAHMRTIETAARAHLADYGFVYTDYNGPNQLFFQTRMKNNFSICPQRFGQTNPSGGGLEFAADQADFYAQGIHCPLTTPINYLDADQLTDPFSDGTIPMGYDSREGELGQIQIGHGVRNVLFGGTGSSRGRLAPRPPTCRPDSSRADAIQSD